MGLLEIKGISVNFGGLAALTDVDMTAPAGQITGLIGPNGAGKTTLFNVITGLQRPTRGAVVLNGQDLKGKSVFARSRLGLGRTFQRLELFGTLTVRENIEVAASLARRHGRAATALAIDEECSRLIRELDLGAIAESRADILPTGSGRVVELARALATQPSVLLLDEPASGQSADETERFASVLRSVAERGLAVLLVEHDVDLVMSLCSEVVVLDYGRVLTQGVPEAVQADPRVRAAYLGTVEAAPHG
jgi:branched-chain amino acid transport system ATP-binding protein